MFCREWANLMFVKNVTASVPKTTQDNVAFWPVVKKIKLPGFLLLAIPRHDMHYVIYYNVGF